MTFDVTRDDPGDSMLTVDQYRRAVQSSKLEQTFDGQLRMLFIEQGWCPHGIAREFEFDRWHGRKWRADFAIDQPVSLVMESPEYAFEDATAIILIDIEGTSRYTFGRHERIDGYTNDTIKYSAASALGYTVLRGTSQMVHDGVLVEMVRQVLTGELDLTTWKVTT